MSAYRICEECGAALDPGERCDCLPTAAPLKPIQPAENPYPDGDESILEYRKRDNDAQTP